MHAQARMRVYACFYLRLSTLFLKINACRIFLQVISLQIKQHLMAK
jgi:hypothetical protein